jgi:Phage integrase, N-terminal SAM-like domain
VKPAHGLLHEPEQAVEPATRMRVGEYAQLWMKSKALKLDGATARTYADALEQHILPRLGDLYDDVLTGRDVQAWVDDAILIGWKTKRGVKKRYSPWSVHAWFRVFRAMTRDAMHELVLERDPTLRVSFPAAEEKMDPNCLEPEELAAFLAAMRAEFPASLGALGSWPTPGCGSVTPARCAGRTGTATSASSVSCASRCAARSRR